MSPLAYSIISTSNKVWQRLALSKQKCTVDFNTTALQIGIRHILVKLKTLELIQIFWKFVYCTQLEILFCLLYQTLTFMSQVLV